MIHLFFGELSLKTPDFKRLPGFAKIYLGSGAEKIAMFSIILGFFGRNFGLFNRWRRILKRTFISDFGMAEYIFYTLFYFAVGAIFIYFGIKAIAKIEFMGLVLIFLILVILFIKEFSSY